MNIKEFEYNTEYGFAWIILEDGNTVQCCLYAPDELPTEKTITMSDCGHNWGCCGDANDAAFEKYGENRCMKALFAEAKLAGINVKE